ncbi:MAG: hypothetical protein GKR94_26935 [Gammaproteobacteria bacterium]|nr:hypothetical protein [Gammaproteobacteria bacterium]
MKQRTKQRIGLIGVFALFFIPVVAALFLWANPRLLGALGTTNYGVLLPEARQITPPSLRSAAIVKGESPGFSEKWSMITLDSGSCSNACRARLHALWTAHVATNKDIDRVARVLLLPEDAQPVADFTNEDGLAVFKVPLRWAQTLTGESDPFSPGRVYLVDPRGFVFMYYPDPLDARDLLKDLKRLLKISKVG